MVQNSESRSLEKVIVRLPDGMRDSLKALAHQSNRSLNAQIVHMLEWAIEEMQTLVAAPEGTTRAALTSEVLRDELRRTRRMLEAIIGDLEDPESDLNEAVRQRLQEEGNTEAKKLKTPANRSVKGG